MRKLSKLFVLAVLFAPALASAQMSLGARLGYGFAMGEVAQNVDLADGVKSQVPIQLDVGYRVTPAFTLGGYFSYGVGQEGDNLGCSGDCSIRVYRLGVQLDYTFRSASVAPWIGGGLGYEWASITDNTADAKLSFKGWELLNLQGGLDWKLADKFSFGPFAMFSIGQYSTESVESGGSSAEGDIPNKGIHQWFQLGVRGKFDL